MENANKTYEKKKKCILLDKSNISNTSFNYNDLKTSNSLNKQKIENLKNKIKLDYRKDKRNVIKIYNSSKKLTKNDNENTWFKEEKTKNKNSINEKSSNDKLDKNNNNIICNLKKIKTNKEYIKVNNRKILLNNNNTSKSIKTFPSRDFINQDNCERNKSNIINVFKTKNSKKDNFDYFNIQDKNCKKKNEKIITKSYRKSSNIHSPLIIKNIYLNTDKNIISFQKSFKIKRPIKIKLNSYRKYKFDYSNNPKAYEKNLSTRYKIKENNPFSNPYNNFKEKDIYSNDLQLIKMKLKKRFNDNNLILNKTLLSNLGIEMNEKENENFFSKLNLYQKNVNKIFDKDKYYKNYTYSNNRTCNSNKENTNNSNNKSNKINNQIIKKPKKTYKKINYKNRHIERYNYNPYKNSSSLSTQDLFQKYNNLLKKSQNFTDNSNSYKTDKIKLQTYDIKLVTKKIAINASIIKKGTNNDSINENYNQTSLFKVKFSDINYSFYGVCNGYGPNGYLISEYIKNNLPIIFYKKLKNIIINENSNLISDINKKTINYEKIYQESFSDIESAIINNKKINIDFSGSTCVSLLFSSNSIISANIGDKNRAIKGQFLNNKWSYKILTRGHKPKEREEKEKIIKLNGDISPLLNKNRDYNSSERIWIKEKNYHNLTMIMTIGDKIRKEGGFCSEPEIKTIPYQEYDKFVVIATDGFWKYVLNDEVIEIVSYYYNLNDCDSAVVKLYEIAYNRWMHKHRYIKDISIIVVFIE